MTATISQKTKKLGWNIFKSACLLGVSIEGRGVGAGVGFLVGAGVRGTVGAIVGTFVGEGVARTVGEGVARTVGEGVGESVGGEVGVPGTTVGRKEDAIAFARLKQKNAVTPESVIGITGGALRQFLPVQAEKRNVDTKLIGKSS